MINVIANLSIPIIVGAIIIYGIYRKVPVFDDFLAGVQENISVGISILPALIALMTAIGVFKASGVLDFIIKILTPILSYIHMPPELLPQALLRPMSNSGSLVFFKETLSTYGPDSFLGRAASIMQGSSETTLYVITIYFGAVGIKNIKYTLRCALFADLVCVVTSIFIASLY
jgi:spore maturation protein B